MGKKDYIFSTQMSMFGKREIIGFGSNEFYIKEISRNLANEIIIKNHYSKKVFNNSYIHLGCFINDELLGVLQFGHLLNNLSVSNNGRSASKSAKANSLKERKETAIVHTFRQFRYIYFVNPKLKKLCRLTECPYPKHYAGGAILNVNTSTTL